MSAYVIETFPVGSFQCNCSLVLDQEKKTAIVVDPGEDARGIIARLESHGVQVTALWHTHAHLDHVGATLPLLEWATKKNAEKGLPPPGVYLHEGDRWLYEHIEVQSGLLGLRPFPVPAQFTGIKQDQVYDGFAGVKALVTPGHTPGSCCLSVEHNSFLACDGHMRGGTSMEGPRVLISGDTLFRRSIGRTDLWGGDTKLILKSIHKKVLTLAGDTVVIPGHGPFTTIEAEQAKNPFLQGEAP